MKLLGIILFICFTFSCSKTKNQEAPIVRGTTIKVEEHETKVLDDLSLYSENSLGVFEIKRGIDSISKERIYSSWNSIIYCALISRTVDLIEKGERNEWRYNNDFEVLYLDYWWACKNPNCGSTGCKEENFYEWEEVNTVKLNVSEEVSDSICNLSINGNKAWALPIANFSYFKIKPGVREIKKGSPYSLIVGDRSIYPNNVSTSLFEQHEHLDLQIGYLGYGDVADYDLDKFFHSIDFIDYVTSKGGEYRGNSLAYFLKE